MQNTYYGKKLFRKIPSSQRWLSPLVNAMKDGKTVASACGYDLTNHHHALADAEACAAIAMKLL